jgi:hypothetical protein
MATSVLFRASIAFVFWINARVFSRRSLASVTLVLRDREVVDERKPPVEIIHRHSARVDMGHEPAARKSLDLGGSYDLTSIRMPVESVDERDFVLEGEIRISNFIRQRNAGEELGPLV